MLHFDLLRRFNPTSNHFKDHHSVILCSYEIRILLTTELILKLHIVQVLDNV